MMTTMTTTTKKDDVAIAMSVREWLAGQALGGLLANPDARDGTPLEYAAKDRAVAAVVYADALLQVLRKAVK